MLVGLGLLPIAATVIAYPFLPETVGVHYGIFGVDDFGPKWRLLLVPGLLSTLCNFVFFGLYESSKRKNLAVLNGEGFSIVTCLGFMILFDVVSLVLIIISF